LAIEAGRKIFAAEVLSHGGQEATAQVNASPRGTAGAWRWSGWVVAAIFAGALPARPNGAFPDEFSIHFPPGAPNRILVGANFGLLVSEDNGASWRYSCEPWIVAGSSAAVNPEASVIFYQVTSDGALLADAVNITRSGDNACTWPTSPGIEGTIITDLWASPADPSLVFVTAAVSNGSYIVASHDGGKTFNPTRLYDTSLTSADDHTGDVITGLESSRSLPSRVYATKVSTTGSTATLLRNDNSGAGGEPTWVSTTIGAGANTQPRILTIDPADEKTVWIRLSAGITDAIAVTTDSGATFSVPLQIRGQFSSFLRATDGTVYAGTSGGELYIRPPGAIAFNAPLTGKPHFRCLGQRFGEPKRIYACADGVVDGFNLYSTDDGGQTFTGVMKFTQIQGPLACGPVDSNCQAHWQRIQSVLGIGSPVTDAGTGGGGGGGGGSGGPGGGSCASLGVGAGASLILLAFALRRRK
jgi:hypothetical protein